MGRVIITIDEIIAGRGLRSNKSTKPPSLEVFCGCGLEYGRDEDLAIKNGPGINFNENREIQVNNADIAGFGLIAGNGCQVDIDTTPDKCMQQTFRTVTEAKFQMDGYRLVFCTTYTNYIVNRNSVGVVLGIEEGDSVTECQPLNIDGYGYGNSPTGITNSTSQPSFYK